MLKEMMFRLLTKDPSRKSGYAVAGFLYVRGDLQGCFDGLSIKDCLKQLHRLDGESDILFDRSEMGLKFKNLWFFEGDFLDAGGKFLRYGKYDSFDGVQFGWNVTWDGKFGYSFDPEININRSGLKVFGNIHEAKKRSK